MEKLIKRVIIFDKYKYKIFIQKIRNYNDILTVYEVFSEEHYNLKKYNHESKLGIRLNDWKLNTTTTYDCDCNLYEATIHPIIKFIHDTNINPVGWIEIDNYTETTITEFTSDIEVNIKVIDIKPLSIEKINDFKIASFDIECDSSHGSFPVAIKSFEKPSRDILEVYIDMIKNYSEYTTDVGTIQMDFRNGLMGIDQQMINLQAQYQEIRRNNQALREKDQAIYGKK